MKVTVSPFGSPMRPLPHGHRPAIARKNSVLPAPGIAGDDDALAEAYVDMRVGKLGAAGRRADLDIVEGQVAGIGFGDLDALFDIVQLVDLEHRRAEGGNAQQGCAPVGDAADIVDEPAQRGMHLVERADRHHQPAETHVAGEIDR